MLKFLLACLVIVLTVTPCFADIKIAEYISTRDKDNYVLLREHIDRIMLEKDKYFELRFSQAQDALTLSKKELDRRLEELNELRKSVEKDRVQFVKVESFNFKMEAHDIAVSSLDKRITVIETRAVTWTAAVGAFFLIVQIALWIWFNKRNGKRQ